MAELKEQCNTLWVSFQSGDETAYRALYDLTYGALFRCGLTYLDDSATIRDLMQEAYLSLWRQGERDIVIKDVWVYLLATFRNRVIDHLRKVKKMPVMNELAVASPEDDMVEAEVVKLRKKWLQEQLHQLPDRQREALYLRYQIMLDYPDIADVLNVSLQVAYNYVNRGIKALKQRVEKAPDWLLLFFPLLSLLS